MFDCITENARLKLVVEKNWLQFSERCSVTAVPEWICEHDENCIQTRNEFTQFNATKHMISSIISPCIQFSNRSVHSR